MNNVSGRNVTVDGYNLGLKYQCVEFVKRYYYKHYRHKMPNSYGNAKDFFIAQISDGRPPKSEAQTVNLQFAAFPQNLRNRISRRDSNFGRL